MLLAIALIRSLSKSQSLKLMGRFLRSTLAEDMKSRLEMLSLPNLEDLSEVLLDFTSLADLQGWLEGQSRV